MGCITREFITRLAHMLVLVLFVFLGFGIWGGYIVAAVLNFVLGMWLRLGVYCGCFVKCLRRGICLYSRGGWGAGRYMRWRGYSCTVRVLPDGRWRGVVWGTWYAGAGYGGRGIAGGTAGVVWPGRSVKRRWGGFQCGVGEDKNVTLQGRR